MGYYLHFIRANWEFFQWFWWNNSRFRLQKKIDINNSWIATLCPLHCFDHPFDWDMLIVPTFVGGLRSDFSVQQELNVRPHWKSYPAFSLFTPTIHLEWILQGLMQGRFLQGRWANELLISFKNLLFNIRANRRVKNEVELRFSHFYAVSEQKKTWGSFECADIFRKH